MNCPLSYETPTMVNMSRVYYVEGPDYLPELVGVGLSWVDAAWDLRHKIATYRRPQGGRLCLFH